MYLLLKHIFSFLYATRSAMTKTKKMIKIARVSPTTAAIGIGSERRMSLTMIIKQQSIEHQKDRLKMF